MNDMPHAAHDAEEVPLPDETAASKDRDLFMKGVATVAVVGVAAAIVEVSLIPGMILGVAAAVAPKYLPEIGNRLQPMFRSTVRGIYKLNRKTRETVAEAQERVQDIVAEVHAEGKTSEPAAEPKV